MIVLALAGCEAKMPSRYDGIDFQPPESVARQAARGLDLRAEFGRGGTAIGVARARDLKNRKTLSPSTIGRMVSYFARHEVDREADGWGDAENPSAGWIAWLLWGGDPGRAWAKRVKRQMDRADDEANRSGMSWLTKAPADGHPHTAEARAVRWRRFLRDQHRPLERDLSRRLATYLRGAARRIGERLAERIGERQVVGLVQRSLSEDEIDAIFGASQEAAALRTAIGARLIEAVKRAFAIALQEMAVDGIAFDPTLSPAEQIIGALIANVNQGTKDAAAKVIRAGLLDGSTVNDMQAALMRSPGFSPMRALRIARTEATKTINKGSTYAYREAANTGVKVKKEWLTARDGLVRDGGEMGPGNHVVLDGQRVDPSEPFVVPPEGGQFAGATADGPGDFTDAAMVVNCRCTVTPYVED